MLNKIFLMGRLTRDPELRRTQTGTPVASFSLAVDRDFKDKATGERSTDFIDVVRNRAANFLRRGRPVKGHVHRVRQQADCHFLHTGHCGHRLFHMRAACGAGHAGHTEFFCLHLSTPFPDILF